MKKSNTKLAANAESEPIRVRLPGFISEDVGFGDVIKHVTNAAGIRTCGGCQKRAQTLNSWLVFSAGKK